MAVTAASVITTASNPPNCWPSRVSGGKHRLYKTISCGFYTQFRKWYLFLVHALQQFMTTRVMTTALRPPIAA